MKKLLSLLIVLAMVLAMVPAASAVEARASGYVFVDANSTLQPGEHELTLADTSKHNLYIFKPDEIGVYTISVSEGATVGYWGAGTFFVKDPNSTATSIEREIKQVGQQVVFGIASDSSAVTVTIEKTGESGGIVQVTYEMYQNVHTPDVSNVIPATDMTEVDITVEHEVVLGDDGYYHIGGAEGPVLYMDLTTNGFNLLNACYGTADSGEVATRMRDGKKYDYIECMRLYAKVLQSKDGLYPVTEDLYNFVNGYGAAQGWFFQNLSTFEKITAGGFQEESAWMVACYYDQEQMPEESEDQYIGLETDSYAIQPMEPGINYYLSFFGFDLPNPMDAPKVIVSWEGNVTITLNGDEISSPYTIDAYIPRLAVLLATVTEPTEVAFTVEQVIETVPGSELILGENNILVEDVFNGEVYTFTAKLDGEYVLSAAEGETNACVIVEAEYGEVILPYTFSLKSGETFTCIIFTLDYEVDVINLILTAKGDEPVDPPAGNQLIPGENNIQVSDGYNGVAYTFTSKLDGKFVITAAEGETNALIIIEDGMNSGMYWPADEPFVFEAEAGVTYTIIIATDSGDPDEINLILSQYAEEPPVGNQLVLGENNIQVSDGYNGVAYTFTPAESGAYVISAADGETNALIIIEDGMNSGMYWPADEPFVFEAEAGVTYTIIIATDSGDPDEINLILALQGDEPVDPPVEPPVDECQHEWPEYPMEEYHDDGSITVTYYCTKCDELLLQETYAPGTAENPIFVVDANEDTANVEFTAQVPAGQTMHYVTFAMGATLTMPAGEYTVWVNGEQAVAVDGLYAIELSADEFIFEIVVENHGAADAVIDMIVAYTPGTILNPEELVLGKDYTLDLPVGNLGYYFIYTGTCPGELVVNFGGEAGWAILIYNQCDPDNYDDDITMEFYHDDEVVVNQATLAVKPGDQILIVMSTSLDEELGDTTAGIVNLRVDLTHAVEGLEKHEATAPTCTVDGTVEYYTCQACGLKFNAEGVAIEDITAPATGHTLTHVERVEPTTEAEGTLEHWICESCQGIYSDAEGKNAVEAKDLVIDKLPAQEQPGEKPEDPDDNPNSGDSMGLIFALIVVSAMGIVAVVSQKKRFF